MNIHKNLYQNKACFIMNFAYRSEFNLDTSKANKNHKFHLWLWKISTTNFMRRKPKESWNTKATVDFCFQGGKKIGIERITKPTRDVSSVGLTELCCIL